MVHIMAQPVMNPGDGPIVLVLAPTRELAVQIQEECTRFNSSNIRVSGEHDLNSVPLVHDH